MPAMAAEIWIQVVIPSLKPLCKNRQVHVTCSLVDISLLCGAGRQVQGGRAGSTAGCISCELGCQGEGAGGSPTTGTGTTVPEVT